MLPLPFCCLGKRRFTDLGTDISPFDLHRSPFCGNDNLALQRVRAHRQAHRIRLPIWDIPWLSKCYVPCRDCGSVCRLVPTTVSSTLYALLGSACTFCFSFRELCTGYHLLFPLHITTLPISRAVGPLSIGANMGRTLPWKKQDAGVGGSSGAGTARNSIATKHDRVESSPPKSPAKSGPSTPQRHRTRRPATAMSSLHSSSQPFHATSDDGLGQESPANLPQPLPERSAISICSAQNPDHEAMLIQPQIDDSWSPTR